MEQYGSMFVRLYVMVPSDQGELRAKRVIVYRAYGTKAECKAECRKWLEANSRLKTDVQFTWEVREDISRGELDME